MDTSINAQELKTKIENNENILILDVRQEHEFEQWHIPNAINIPLDKLALNYAELPPNKEINTICLHGMRSQSASNFLEQKNLNVKSVAGGMVAWNSVYDIVELPASNFRIFQIRRLGKGCLSYMIISNNEAAVIDPTIDFYTYISAVQNNNAKIIAVLDTHTHADHVSGGRRLADEVESVYYSSDKTLQLGHEDVKDLKIGDIEIVPLPTPGHTPESTTYLVGNFALTGDTLFVESIGRPDLGQDSEENAAILFDSLHQKILTLPPTTVILPGHFSSEIKPKVAIASSINDVKKLKPIQLQKDEFIDYISKNNAPKPENFEYIKKINQGIEFSDEEEIRDLEAGPNRCAVKTS